MSERKTGATSAQIEAAAKKKYQADQPFVRNFMNFGAEPEYATWDEVRVEAPKKLDRWVERFAANAQYLVPPGYAIVSRDDLRAVLAYVPEEVFDVDDLAVDMAAVGLREVLGE